MTPEWKHFLLRSIGLEPLNLTERQVDMFLLRMVPFVENNFNLVDSAARDRQESPLPADFPLRPPGERREGDRRPDVREHGVRPAWSCDRRPICNSAAEMSVGGMRPVLIIQPAPQ